MDFSKWGICRNMSLWDTSRGQELTYPALPEPERDTQPQEFAGAEKISRQVSPMSSNFLCPHGVPGGAPDNYPI